MGYLTTLSQSCLLHFFLITDKIAMIMALMYPIVEAQRAISYLPGCNAVKMKNTMLRTKIASMM